MNYFYFFRNIILLIIIYKMSLVICSNQDADGQSERLQSSVFKPWAFRNTLSSTYKIPANSQVALQSCKVNIDGRVVLSSANSKFYQYFGQKLDLDGTTAPQEDQTTSYPVYTDFLLNSQEGILEVTIDDFANTIQAAIRETTFHPNVKDKPTCEVLRNASSLDFLGYKITYDQTTAKEAGVPANDAFEQWYRKDGLYSDVSGSGIFSFSSGVFTRVTASDKDTCAAICPKLPMHNLTGELTVNISGTSGRANASGVEWHVGLSRYINNIDDDGYYYPPYTNHRVFSDFFQEIFVDFGIARDSDGDLVLYQYGWDNTYKELVYQEIQYWTNTNSYFTSKENISGKNYTDVKFEVKGEVVIAKIYDSTAKAWRTITEYAAGEPKNSYYKPVHQACWCLHPVLAIGTDEASALNCTLQITEFNDVDVVDYDPKVAYKGGWYETMELTNNLGLCKEVESRKIIETTDATAYTQVEVNASDGIVYDNVFILQQSDIYKETPGANAGPILGFNSAIVDTPTTIVDLNKKSYHSNFAPSLVSSLSMFVRLNNFGQSTTNARVGNRSKILAHLTDLENKSGRNTYEPSNLIWLDLDNTADLNINEFDISFCYVNEQFATILTGQSIVALYFRKKPRDFD
jgi:hypothetical protein